MDGMGYTCYLGGGCETCFYFYPYLGTWSKLTSIVFKWVAETTNELFIAYLSEERKTPHSYLVIMINHYKDPY